MTVAANGLLFVDIVILGRKNINISFNTPGARSHPGEGLKSFESPLGRAGPRPQSGASFSAFSTVSCPGLSPLAGSVGPRVAARSGAALFDEECRQDPEFLNRVLGLERMLRVNCRRSFLEPRQPLCLLVRTRESLKSLR